MENLKDFITAALPWLAIGLALAFFFARSAKKKRSEKKVADYGSEGMCIGMCVGVALGSSLGMGIGISLGMLIGLVVGSCIQKEEQDEGE